MKLAVMGGSGFLGGRIVDFYQEKWEVLAPAHEEVDITDEKSVDSFLAHSRPDGVIVCAAVSDVGRCQQEPEKSRKINVDGSVHAARACHSLGIRCVVCSSDQVYFGAPGNAPHREDEALTPANEYGRQKLDMERLCLGENPDCVILRLTWMYDSQKRTHGEHDNLLPGLLAEIRAGKIRSFPIHDRRGITPAELVVKNLEKALALPGGIYNFGCGGRASVCDTMAQVFAQIGLPKPEQNPQAFAQSPRNISMDLRKIENYGIAFPETADAMAEILKRELKI